MHHQAHAIVQNRAKLLVIWGRRGRLLADIGVIALLDPPGIRERCRKAVHKTPAVHPAANGKEHAGTDDKELFAAPPPPPSPYQRGRFNPTGLGEQVLKRGPSGAVAYIGCNTGSQPCGLTLVEGFVTALAEAKEPRLGDCWASAIRHYFDKEHLATLKPNADWYPPSIFFQGMKFMLFGDPSLRLPANRP